MRTIRWNQIKLSTVAHQANHHRSIGNALESQHQLAKLRVAARVFVRVVADPAIRCRNKNFGHFENVVDLGIGGNALPLEKMAGSHAGVDVFLVCPQGKEGPQANDEQGRQYLDCSLGRTITGRRLRHHGKTPDKPPSR